jgi:hypothetical protein
MMLLLGEMVADDEADPRDDSADAERDPSRGGVAPKRSP